MQTFKNNSMKKLLLVIAILFTTHLSFAAVTPSGTSSILTSFNRDFHKAAYAQWQHYEAYDKVSFLLDNRFMTAYYTLNGELIAVTRNIISEQLPLKLILELKKNYSNLWISELFEVVRGSVDQYYITLENANEKLILKAKAHKSWKLYQKIVKL
jgi:hypothetical protein